MRLQTMVDHRWWDRDWVWEVSNWIRCEGGEGSSAVSVWVLVDDDDVVGV